MTTGNNNMATQIGSTYSTESMIDIIKIPTTNLRFSITASLKRISLGDSNYDREPKMATETGNVYICETVNDSIEILTANLQDLRACRARIKCRQVTAPAIENRK